MLIKILRLLRCLLASIKGSRVWTLVRAPSFQTTFPLMKLVYSHICINYVS